MSELLVFYGLLSIPVALGLGYGIYLYHKHSGKNDHHSNAS